MFISPSCSAYSLSADCWSALMLHGHNPAILHLRNNHPNNFNGARESICFPVTSLLTFYRDNCFDTFNKKKNQSPRLFFSRYSPCLPRFITLTVLAVSTLKVIYCSTENNEINCVLADGQNLPSISLRQWVCRDSTTNFPSAQPIVLKSVMGVN